MSELSRLRWLCRRGMKELDVVLTRYLEENYTQSTPEQQQTFKEILALQDPQLYALMLGREVSENAAISELIARIAKQN